jgi:hypothetical protein
MDMSGQLRAPAVLTVGKHILYTIKGRYSFWSFLIKAVERELNLHVSG